MNRFNRLLSLSIFIMILNIGMAEARQRPGCSLKGQIKSWTKYEISIKENSEGTRNRIPNEKFEYDRKGRLIRQTKYSLFSGKILNFKKKLHRNDTVYIEEYFKDTLMPHTVIKYHINSNKDTIYYSKSNYEETQRVEIEKYIEPLNREQLLDTLGVLYRRTYSNEVLRKYDINGQMVREENYIANRLSFLNTCKYSPTGKIIQAKSYYYPTKKLKKHTKYKYSAEDKLISKETKFLRDQVNSEVVIYDEDERPLTKTKYLEDGVEEEVSRYEYRDDTVLVVNNSYNRLRYEKLFFLSGENYQLIYSRFYAEDGSVVYEEVKKYHENGKLSEQVESNPNEGNLIYIYRYNLDGRLVEEIDFNDDGVLKSWVTIEYDKNGNCLKVLDYDSVGNITGELVYKNEYDSHDNLVSFEMYYDGKKGYAAEIEIEYYE